MNFTVTSGYVAMGRNLKSQMDCGLSKTDFFSVFNQPLLWSLDPPHNRVAVNSADKTTVLKFTTSQIFTSLRVSTLLQNAINQTPV